MLYNLLADPYDHQAISLLKKDIPLILSSSR